MNQRVVMGCSVMVWAAVSTVSAQSLKDAGAARAKTDPRSAAKAEDKAQFFEKNADLIVKTVNPSDPEGIERLRHILREWDATYASNGIIVSRKAANADPGLLEKRDILEREMKEAAAAGDAAKLEQGATDLAQIEALIGGYTPAQETTRREINEKFRAVAANFLSTDELARLDSVVERTWLEQSGRGRAAPDRSPIALKKIVDRLHDLTPTQRQSIETAFRDHQLADRAASPKDDAAAKKARTKKLYDDVFAVLTEGQKAHVERELSGRDATATDKSADGSGKPDDAAGKPGAVPADKGPVGSAGEIKGSETKGVEPKK